MQNTESGRKLNQAMASTGRAVATTGKAVGKVTQFTDLNISWVIKYNYIYMEHLNIYTFCFHIKIFSSHTLVKIIH